MAEMSVPAWPMPTQKTKLVMSKAHPTLLFRPQTPIPLETSQATIPRRFSSAAKARAKQIHHPFPARPSSGRATSSAISRSEGFPSTHSARARTGACILAMATRLMFRPLTFESF